AMMDGNEFFYGGTRGFWQDTVRSLIEVSLYSQSDPPSLLKVILEVSVLVLLLFSGWIFIYNNRQKKSVGTVEPFEILMVFFVLSIGFSIMQHFVLGTRYLIDRTASHILVLFLLVMVFTFRAAFQRSRAGITIAYKAIIFVITILYVINFIRVANVSYYLLWRYDASCKHVIEYLSDIYKNKAPPDNSITLGANWINEPALNYYIIFRFDLRWMRGVDRSGPDGNYNYYILQEADRHLIDTLNLKVLERFPVSGTTLAACAGPPPEIH
nr:hypothetical protein [bacterium]